MFTHVICYSAKSVNIDYIFLSSLNHNPPNSTQACVQTKGEAKTREVD